MEIITTRQQLITLAATLGVSHDWHEPDQVGVTAEVQGASFDNAMGPGDWYGPEDDPRAEMHVILKQYAPEADPTTDEGRPVAVVNLATLLAWATGHDGTPPPVADATLADRAARTLTRLRVTMSRLESGENPTTRDRADMVIAAIGIETLESLLEF